MNQKTSWIDKLKQGLQKTSEKLNTNINSFFVHEKLTQESLDDLLDGLIMSDIGVETAKEIVDNFSKNTFNQNINQTKIKLELSKQIAKMLEPVSIKFDIENIKSKQPYVFLITGVNGSGKTTTIGKLARYFRNMDLSVMLVAGDTFRAAAIEQLTVWGAKTGCPVIKKEQGADAAGLIFDALEQAKKRQYDVVLIDTAGRLQNQKHLMEELSKIDRVIKKVIPQAPHNVIQVLDATAGQNSLSQVELFSKSVQTTGLIITKLDGTAKGGSIVTLANKFQIPIYMIGVGEKAEDMQPFNHFDFSFQLLGI